MSRRGARILAVVYFGFFAIGTTWPGIVPFNRIRPFVLGLPFSLAWEAFLIVGGFTVLWVVHSAESRADRGDARPGERP